MNLKGGKQHDLQEASGSKPGYGSEEVVSSHYFSDQCYAPICDPVKFVQYIDSYYEFEDIDSGETDWSSQRVYKEIEREKWYTNGTVHEVTEERENP